MHRVGPLSVMARVLKTVLLVVCMTACTDENLMVPPTMTNHPLDNKLAINGQFCADGATKLNAFLKIMLIIDRSNSMQDADPTNARINAAIDLVSSYFDDPVTQQLRAGVEFAVLSFFGDVVTHTRNARDFPGFSNDGPKILVALGQAATQGSLTGYDKALGKALLLLDADMAHLPDAARALSRYEVVFLSDGTPENGNCQGEANSPSAAVAAVKRIALLESIHGVTLRLHTAFLSAPGAYKNPPANTCGTVDVMMTGITTLGDQTEELLRQMANAGKGTFLQFQGGDAISFARFGFADARKVYSIRNFVASNTNGRPYIDTVLPDSDADGLTDEQEIKLGTSPYLQDSDNDGFNDQLEMRFRLSGLDPLDATDAVCDDFARIDSDGDGLRDCEEMFLGTLRLNVDSDADGVPDAVEFRFGANANSATPLQDLQADSDADGGTNLDEIRWHTDPTQDDVAYRSRIAYDYVQTALPLTQGRTCYDFSVQNISLASTQSAPDWQMSGNPTDLHGWNRIMLHFAQTPNDNPLGDPLYQVACVDARYIESRDLKSPPHGQINLPPTRPSDTFSPRATLHPMDPRRCDASVNQDCGIDSNWCRFEDDGTCQCYSPPLLPNDPANGILLGACPQCSDGIDNDNDGLTDFPNDPDCFDSWDRDEQPNQPCSDGIDNDNDGKIDWPLDPGCKSSRDVSGENDPASLPECADGLDNNNNGATDFPEDPGCFAASDPVELQVIISPTPACNDGYDNDGDGLTDFPTDPGCFTKLDVDESGPSACFYCEQFSDNRPGQCDKKAGLCKPRNGPPPPPTTTCTDNSTCRGSICDTLSGRCKPCLRDSDCTGGICDASKGWCLVPSAPSTPKSCTEGCGEAACIEGLQTCAIDPYYACTHDGECNRGELCSQAGFCLAKTYATAQCGNDADCDNGICDTTLGWCLPTTKEQQCQHDLQCPKGTCTAKGYCLQATFVPPLQFNPDIDCIRAR